MGGRLEASPNPLEARLFRERLELCGEEGSDSSFSITASLYQNSQLDAMRRVL